jgi:periplasmic protein TonB
VPGYLKPPASERAVSLAAVAALHALLIVLLVTQSGTVRSLLPQSLQVKLLPQITPPPPPPKQVTPELKPPDLAELPIPEIVIAQPTSPTALKAIVRVAPRAPPANHFGPAAGDSGLGVEVATSAGGGARGRGSLGDFEAAVKRAVLRRKVQPTIAWDHRNTCVINYTVSVARDGSLANFSIDACAVPEINQAAQNAIRAAGPFPLPPDLGAAHYDVHGTLIFHP